MNSYPPELLAQLAPVMFIAGLDAPASTTAPLSPTAVASAPKPQDSFQVLTLRLREALLAQRKVAIWQPEKNKSFQVSLVDKEVKFPPRKLVPPDDLQYSAAHSPLSPLTPTSPLHPDGLIAPIWIRKHTTLVPSVFVLFMRIYEHPPPASQTPLDLPDNDREREREAEQKRKDSELAVEVAQRKKITNERGIKLTVVLMASRKMLDDPTLDSRLTFIRRQSGLDSRAALFVLSPVSPSELNEFVRSLQQALYEPALEYYTAHSKRVRRKRNRHSQAVSTHPTQAAALGVLNIARPLRPEGWTVRYEYKMACFAEFRSEDEVALKHYQDAYEMLIIMFGSTAILPPRTKRWAEAKVLADCINIKIVKLYLYNNEHSLALSHHNTHIRQFGDFSRGWGIGEETFEFWSWVARQHRVLAELLEQGTRSTLVLPVHKPATSTTNLSQSQQTLRAATGAEYDMKSLGINPNHALQHPGFYYYVAARCTEMRRSRFLAALETEQSQKPVAVSPGFTNEKKVEHLAIINEAIQLYTKAYELFKKHSPANQGQGRLTLWIAYRIAQTYYDAGKFDMAVRFFERIAKTYRREKWNSMLRPLLVTWYACAQQLGDVELSINLLIEILGHDVVDSDDPSSLEDDLIAVLKSTVPASLNQSLVVDLSEAQPLFDSDVAFWSSEVKVGEQAAFQLRLTAPSSVTIASIPFASIAIHFSNHTSPIIVEHESSDSESNVRVVDLGHISQLDNDHPNVKADLRWQPGATIIFKGSMSTELPSVLKINSCVLTIEENGWTIEIPFEPHGNRSPSDLTGKWLSSVDPPRFVSIQREEHHSTIVKHRTHHLKLTFHHHAPAYLDEDYPIEIEVTNTDTRDLQVSISLLLQPLETEDVVNWIVVDGERSTSLIKGINLGVLAPGVRATKTMHLFNTGAGGDRMVDVSIQTNTATLAAEDGQDENESEDEDEQDSVLDTMEHLKMLVIPTVNPLQVTQTVSYRRNLDSWPGLADLETFDENFWDDSRGGEALVMATMSCVGPWTLKIQGVELDRRDTQHAKIIDSSTDLTEDEVTSDFPAEYIAGDEFSAYCRIRLASDNSLEDVPEPIEGPGRYIVSWCRMLQNGQEGPNARSYFPLTSLRRPVEELVALLDVPPKASLHVPISMTLSIRNYHPTRSANITVHLEPDSLDSFVVSGMRTGRVPVLPPGAEEKLIWRMIPLECGCVKLPRIKVIDRRTAISAAAVQSSGEAVPAPDASTGDLVKVTGLRHDIWLAQADSEPGSRAEYEGQEGLGTILVLP